MDELATVRGPADLFRRFVREASLTTDPADPLFRVIRLSVTPDGFDATAPVGGPDLPLRVRYDREAFDSFSGPETPVLAALGTGATLRWLDWFDAGELTVTFRGDAAAGVASAVELDDGDRCVEVGPLPSDAVDPDLSTGRPDAFADGRLVHEGDPAPVQVETTGETLSRLAAAADIVDDSGVPVVVEDGQFRLSVAGDVMHGRGELPGTVDGPDCHNRYGEELATLARTLRGPVTLHVVPGGPLGVVQEGDAATRRYVLTQVL